ncbi:MAG: L,D-transpeptidase, partial [Steroidobacteraceae bacterium]
VLIDRTCQVMFAGEGDSRLVHVFPTSTGSSGFETRLQDGSQVFRFDPARGNNGWHNSYDYPVSGDNPLNGNMYMPLYFDNGQAIHGANNVPPSPQSKGCARLRVANQDALVDWLGLRDVGQPVWDEDEIGLVVSVQGRF